jgi:hypothetical protein
MVPRSTNSGNGSVGLPMHFNSSTTAPASCVRGLALSKSVLSLTSVHQLTITTYKLINLLLGIRRYMETQFLSFNRLKRHSGEIRKRRKTLIIKKMSGSTAHSLSAQFGEQKRHNIGRSYWI